VGTPPAVVGSPPVWGDDSDATYAEAINQTAGSGLHSPAYGYFPAQTDIPAGAEVAEVVVTVRARHSSGAIATSGGIYWTLDTGGGSDIGATSNSVNPNWTFPATPTSQTMTVPAYGMNEYPGYPDYYPVWRTTLANTLRAGARIYIFTNDPVSPNPYQDDGHQIYEVTLSYVVMSNVNVGQLYANLSTDVNAPNWVSVCPGGAVAPSPVAGADNWASAQELGFGIASVSTPVAGLTVESGENTRGATRTAWWKLPAFSKGQVTLDVNASTGIPGGDPAWWWFGVRVFRGPPILNYLQIIADSDWAVDSITVTLDGRQDYWVQVTGDASLDAASIVLTTSALTPYNATEAFLDQSLTGVVPGTGSYVTPGPYGTPNPWADGDISTYTRTQYKRVPSSYEGSSSIWHPMPTIPPGTVAIGWTVQMMAPTSNYAGKQTVFSLRLQDNAGSSKVAAITFVPADGVAAEYYGVFEPDDYSGWATNLATVLSDCAGGRVSVTTLYNGSSALTATEVYDLYVYDLTLIFYTAGTLPSGYKGHFNASTLPEVPDWRQIHYGTVTGVVLASNEAYLAGSLPPSWDYAVPTAVGSAPKWGDGSDASYVEVFTQGYRTIYNTGSYSGAYTTFPPDPSIPVDAQIDSITLTVRAAHMADANYGINVQLMDPSTWQTAAYTGSVAPLLWTFPDTPTTQTLVLPAYGVVENQSDPNYNPAWDVSYRQRLARALRLGTQLRIYGNSGPVDYAEDAQYRVYEVSIDYSTSWSPVYANTALTGAPVWYTCCSHIP
jgi:hypothetical protein